MDCTHAGLYGLHLKGPEDAFTCPRAVSIGMVVEGLGDIKAMLLTFGEFWVDQGQFSDSLLLGFYTLFINSVCILSYFYSNAMILKLASFCILIYIMKLQFFSIC